MQPCTEPAMGCRSGGFRVCTPPARGEGARPFRFSLSAPLRVRGHVPSLQAAAARSEHGVDGGGGGGGGGGERERERGRRRARAGVAAAGAAVSRAAVRAQAHAHTRPQRAALFA
eukprot:4909993-Pleurochrysis_carterae.AAC.1